MPGVRSMFQSTPVIANGRIAFATVRMLAAPVFQSTPVIANGRIEREAGVMSIEELFQSTPVIANGRIGARGRGHHHRAACFNPRPLLLTGESIEPTGCLHVVRVSIHARYC